MQHSKILISQALSTICGNMARTGDPLGLKLPYWTKWAQGLGFLPQGNDLLYTARMYQMLPFVVQATEMAAGAMPLLPALSIRTFAKMAEIAGAMATEPLLRLGAWRAKELRRRTENALKGIAAALEQAGIHPAYLHEDEPYSGVLLYDLGMEDAVIPIARQVSARLKSSRAKTIITIDPHTTFMLQEVYPRFLPGFNLAVRHYLQVLAASGLNQPYRTDSGAPRKIVFHDSCVMTRDLDIIRPARQVLAALGIEVVEPENTGKDTACCGGPVEYAYADLSRSISGIRARELAGSCKDVLVTCPICLINLMKHEKALGIRVWDMGEILHQCLADQSLPRG